MSDSTISVDPEHDLRQGDIIRKLPEGPNARPRWGFILTADCDIAQNKAGHNYSLLEIIPAIEFLEEVWCSDQLRRFLKKYAKSCLDPLNAAIKKHHRGLAPLTGENLFEWLREESAQRILKILFPTGINLDPKLVATLGGMEVAVKQNQFSKLDTLRQCWTSVGIDSKTQESRIREYLLSTDGFPDFFIFPDLPGEKGYCFAVMLRAISTVGIEGVFKTELDAKIVGQSNAFHRIGRFNDNVKYAVVQKFAFLFSRIGMTEHFESASGAATDILLESLFPGTSQP